MKRRLVQKVCMKKQRILGESWKGSLIVGIEFEFTFVINELTKGIKYEASWCM